VRPERRKAMTPALTGWMAHPAPFAFEPPPMRYREDAFRFLSGTPAIPALIAAREGPRIVREAGIAAIREKSLRQTALIAELARRRGFRSAASPEPSRRGGAVAIDVPNGLEVSRELNARDVAVDFRPGVGIRLSPHFYTEDAEIDRAFQAIDDVVKSGAWERWKGRGGIVP
jgi:kynureninase